MQPALEGLRQCLLNGRIAYVLLATMCILENCRFYILLLGTVLLLTILGKI